MQNEPTVDRDYRGNCMKAIYMRVTISPYYTE